ncbi:MAG: hypothetical protein LDL27_02310 [Desulfovibrio sp.]|nr:hypothetical protein [Desulfovibrio sp.]
MDRFDLTKNVLNLLKKSEESKSKISLADLLEIGFVKVDPHGGWGDGGIVYLLVKDEEVKYVGKTNKALSERWARHKVYQADSYEVYAAKIVDVEYCLIRNFRPEKNTGYNSVTRNAIEDFVEALIEEKFSA